MRTDRERISRLDDVDEEVVRHPGAAHLALRVLPMLALETLALARPKSEHEGDDRRGGEGRERDPDQGDRDPVAAGPPESGPEAGERRGEHRLVANVTDEIGGEGRGRAVPAC